MSPKMSSMQWLGFSNSMTWKDAVVGELTLLYEALEVVSDPGLTVVTCTAEPGTPARESLGLLASWTSTPSDETARSDDETDPSAHT